jgi:hypothetical protein
LIDINSIAAVISASPRGSGSDRHVNIDRPDPYRPVVDLSLIGPARSRSGRRLVMIGAVIVVLAVTLRALLAVALPWAAAGLLIVVIAIGSLAGYPARARVTRGRTRSDDRATQSLHTRLIHQQLDTVTEHLEELRRRDDRSGPPALVQEALARLALSRSAPAPASVVPPPPAPAAPSPAGPSMGSSRSSVIPSTIPPVIPSAGVRLVDVLRVPEPAGSNLADTDPTTTVSDERTADV